jgi:hypothetical protein
MIGAVEINKFLALRAVENNKKKEKKIQKTK